MKTVGLFLFFLALIFAAHAKLLHLPYFWDEAGYYIPAARDLLGGSLIPHSTPSNAHPPLVMAWIALNWKCFGEHIVVTRCAMLVVAAFSLLGFFRLAKAVSNSTVAAASTALVAIYPVFFAQSSLAQVDLPAAGLVFWGLEAYVRSHRMTAILWFALAALAKETAILIPIALLLWEVAGPLIAGKKHESKPSVPDKASRSAASARVLPKPVSRLLLLLPLIPLAAWYSYHYFRTGYVFGNPEFFRYNVQGTMHPLRIFLALFLRLWQLIGYPNLYVLTAACIVAMKYPALRTSSGERPRIAIPTQFAFLTITIVYLITLSVIGGAVLARYMLPVVPLFILVCVSTIWRRLRPWKAVLAIVALAFIAAIFVNPPYGFSLEDNLAYRDYILLHQGAEAFLESRYPHARVLTAWPASDELSRPYLGYVSQPLKVVRIDDFTAEQLLSAADARSQFDVALVFSTKYQPPHSLFDRWGKWQEWKSRFFGYHVDLAPEAAALVLHGDLVYAKPLHGQWVGIVEVPKIEEAFGVVR